MLGYLLAGICVIGQAPSSNSKPLEKEIELSSHFGKFTGCFVMLDVKKSEVSRFNPVRCGERFSPCSTFKVPNSLIGLETGVIPDAEHVIKWDGKKHSREVNNRDHTLRTAVEVSVVWYFQELARRVGPERMQEWVDRIDYGNRDLSAGLTQFWLSSSLTVSADEQVRFLDRLRRGDLPFSSRTMDIVRDILVLQRGDGWVFRGKTGSGGDPAVGLGWFVGWVEKGDEAYVFALNMSGKDVNGYQHAKGTCERILKSMEILPVEYEVTPTK